MSERKPGHIIAVMGMIGGLSGIVTFCTLVFYGGAMAEQVKILNARVTIIETKGTPTVREHITMDEERVRAVGDRISRCEQAMLLLPGELSKIREELSAINARLQAVKERVDKP